MRILESRRKESDKMIKSLMLTLDQDKVRFTPHGKVSVIDIISALCATDEPETIWEEIILDHPEINDYCEDFPYKDKIIKVVDSNGFYMLEKLLFNYLLYQWQEAV
jgi:hypothetical protein